MKWVVVGMGNAGRGHARQIEETAGLQLSGVFDDERNVAETAANERQVPAYASFEALLEDAQIIGVSITTPSALHAGQAVALLEAGKHVVIEKPFALDESEAQDIAEAARRARRLALPFHNRRWDPDFRLVLDIARAGTLGEVRAVRSTVCGPGPDGGWRLQRLMGGGRLNDWGPHLFAQIYEWFGGQPLSIAGYTTTVYPQNECDDLFAAEMLFAPDTRVCVMMSGFSHLSSPRWEVLGTEGTLLLTGNIHGEFTIAWKRRRRGIGADLSPTGCRAAGSDLRYYCRTPARPRRSSGESRRGRCCGSLARSRPGKFRMKTHTTGITISLHETFAPNNAPALFQMARELGYDSVETLAPLGLSDNPNSVSWPTEAESRAAVCELRRLREQSGVRTDTFYGGGLWVLRDEDQPARADGEVNFFSHLIPMLAQECEARVLTLNLAGALLGPGASYGELDRNGSAVGTDVHFQRAAAALRALGEVAAPVGMKIGVEMHGCSLCDCAVATRRLMDLTNHPTIGVTWDTGNLFTMGRAESWEKQLTLLDSFIVNVHLKNSLSGRHKWRRSSLQSGAMEDVEQQVRALCETGSTSALVVEAPGLREGQREMAQTDLRFLQSIISSR